MESVYKNILIPVDGSQQAEAALKKGIRLAKENPNLHLTIVHVIDTNAYDSNLSYDPTMMEEATHRAEKMLEDYVDEAKKAGIEHVRYQIAYGSAKNVITYDLATDEHIDLIIIGATGLNAFERLFMGSVTSFVTEHAPCDVMVVHTDIHNHPIKLDDLK